jgi:hypothetical protein
VDRCTRARLKTFKVDAELLQDHTLSGEQPFEFDDLLNVRHCLSVRTLGGLPPGQIIHLAQCTTRIKRGNDRKNHKQSNGINH